jgi:hypothetical protein
MGRALLELTLAANTDPKLDRLTADLAVLDLCLAPCCQIDSNAEMLGAVRTTHRNESIERRVARVIGNPPRLEHGLEPVSRIDRIRRRS